MKHVDLKRFLVMLPTLRAMAAAGDHLPANVARQLQSVETLLCTLDDEERRAVELRYLKCQQAPKVALALNLSETTLRRRLDSAFAKIEQWLKGGCPCCGRPA